MLLSQRAAKVARTSIGQHFQLRSLVTRLKGVEYRLPQVRLVPAACVSGLASNQSYSAFGELHQDYSMEDAVHNGPLAKRQRTDYDAAANGADHGASDAAQQPPGAEATHGNLQGAPPKKRHNGKECRVPEIIQAVKYNNMRYAMRVFRRCIENEIPLNTGILNSLLYVACGGEQWERYARGLPALPGLTADIKPESPTEGAEGRTVEQRKGQQVEGAEGSTVEQRQRQQVEGAEGSTVEQRKGQQVEGAEGSTVEQRKGQQVEGEKGSMVEQRQGQQVEGAKGSTVEQWKGQQVEGAEGSTVEQRQGQQVEGAKGSTVEQRQGQQVEGAEGSTVEKRQGQQVEGAEGSTVEQRQGQHVEEQQADEQLEEHQQLSQRQQLTTRAQQLEELKRTGPPPTLEELVSAVDEVWSYMGTAGLKPDHGTFLALARREALMKDPQAALNWVLETRKSGKPVQLRLFHPAQVGFCLAGDVTQLLHIDSLLASYKLDNTEYEYARLVEGMAAAGTYEQMRSVLSRMQTELTHLSTTTADYIAAFFETNPAAQQAFAPVDQGGCPVLAQLLSASTGGDPSAATVPESSRRRWQVVRSVEVSEDGQCELAGGTLRVIDLEDKDWDAFANAIADLACRNMGSRAGEFDVYIQWLERNGPYDIMVDAANVAFFGQNREGGGFSWPQVMHMYELLRNRFPSKKILVMLHRKRMNDVEAQTPSVQQFLETLRSMKSFYYTPPGANDDWYWLYACVRAKQNGLLISNDELRDHIFSLLRPRHFLKWKERHIAHYRLFSTNPSQTTMATLGKLFSLQMPNPYSACVQQMAESGSWMIPVNDGTWMCVRSELHED